MLAKPATITKSDAKRRPCKSAMEMPPQSRGVAPPSVGGAGLLMRSVACWRDGSVAERRLGDRLAVYSGQRDLDFSGSRHGGRLLYGTSADDWLVAQNESIVSNRGFLIFGSPEPIMETVGIEATPATSPRSALRVPT